MRTEIIVNDVELVSLAMLVVVNVTNVIVTCPVPTTPMARCVMALLVNVIVCPEQQENDVINVHLTSGTWHPDKGVNIAIAIHPAARRLNAICWTASVNVGLRWKTL